MSDLNISPKLYNYYLAGEYFYLVSEKYDDTVYKYFRSNDFNPNIATNMVEQMLKLLKLMYKSGYNCNDIKISNYVYKKIDSNTYDVKMIDFTKEECILERDEYTYFILFLQLYFSIVNNLIIEYEYDEGDYMYKIDNDFDMVNPILCTRINTIQIKKILKPMYDKIDFKKLNTTLNGIYEKYGGVSETFIKNIYVSLDTLKNNCTLDEKKN